AALHAPAQGPEGRRRAAGGYLRGHRARGRGGRAQGPADSALQGPRRDERRAAVGDHDGPGAPHSAPGPHRRQRGGRPSVHRSHGRPGRAAPRLHREQRTQRAEPRYLDDWAGGAMQERRSRILGLGGYVPPRVVTNQDMTQWMDTTNEWIVERTGIEERHWIEPGESGAGMAAKACREALDQAKVDPKDVDMLIYATLSPDHMFPGTGVFTQRALGLKEGCAVLDIRQQCTGFIYGVAIADNFIRAGTFKTILVVGAAFKKTGLDVSTNGRDVAVLFGDGAGAVVVGLSDGPEHQILSTHLHADGTDAEILWVEKPGSKDKPMISHEDLEAGRQYPKMTGKKVFKHALTRMPQAIMEGMVANQLKLED